MLDTTNIRTADLPDEMRLLLNAYPRGIWDAHPGFRDKTRQWLGAHVMFRRMAQHVRLDAEAYLDSRLAADDLAAGLSSVGGALVRNLHGHHTWEDRSY